MGNGAANAKKKRRTIPEVLADRADRAVEKAGNNVEDAETRVSDAKAELLEKSKRAARRREISNRYVNPSVTGREALLGRVRAVAATVVVAGLGVVGAKHSNFDFELPDLKLGFNQVTEQRRAPTPGKDFIVFTGAYSTETQALEVANEYNRTSGVGYTGYDFEVLLEENSRGESYFNVVTYADQEGCRAMKQLNTNWQCFSLSH